MMAIIFTYGFTEAPNLVGQKIGTIGEGRSHCAKGLRELASPKQAGHLFEGFGAGQFQRRLAVAGHAHAGGEVGSAFDPGRNIVGPVLAARRPELADRLVPGVLGENLCVRGLDETGVCLGDIWAAGTVLLQVTQPRRPCWKIDHRLATSGMVPLINELHRTGWYFRVVREGALAAGDDLALVERPAPGLTLRGLLESFQAHRPDPDAARRASCSLTHWAGASARSLMMSGVSRQDAIPSLAAGLRTRFEASASGTSVRLVTSR